MTKYNSFKQVFLKDFKIPYTILSSNNPLYLMNYIYYESLINDFDEKDNK